MNQTWLNLPYDGDEEELKNKPDWIQQLHAFTKDSYTLNAEALHEHPSYGVTLFIAKHPIETRFGIFEAYVFQDMIHKGYIVAMAYGDIHSTKQLYTRLHSSCVTSETLRGCDCDCVQQLEAAIEVIAQKGNGILFYLLQEGRGVGYVSKARDRMLVQSTSDRISTFEAYRLLGLKKDYRQYRNVKDICRILCINPDWVVLTNNPDKVQALIDQGLSVVKTETIEFDPGPYNLAYLRSKAESGHILKRPGEMELPSVQPPEPVTLFKPYAVREARRFIYMACYFLPVRPVNGEVVIDSATFRTIFSEKTIDDYIIERLIYTYKVIRKNRFVIKINNEGILEYQKEFPDDPICQLLVTPYWFKVHVYFDVVTGEDYVVLTYGNLEIYDTPVIRLQSESLLNRFPLKDLDNRNKYKRALREIVHYGCGAIVLIYHDGRGAGFGAYSVDSMLMHEGKSYSTEESYKKLGVDFDSREYDAVMTLLKCHYPKNKVQMVMNSPASLMNKREFANALSESGFEIVNWIFLEES